MSCENTLFFFSQMLLGLTFFQRRRVITGEPAPPVVDALLALRQDPQQLFRQQLMQLLEAALDVANTRVAEARHELAILSFDRWLAENHHEEEWLADFNMDEPADEPAGVPWFRRSPRIQLRMLRDAWVRYSPRMHLLMLREAAADAARQAAWRANRGVVRMLFRFRV
jgi:hypothetical protein